MRLGGGGGGERLQAASQTARRDVPDFSGGLKLPFDELPIYWVLSLDRTYAGYHLHRRAHFRTLCTNLPRPRRRYRPSPAGARSAFHLRIPPTSLGRMRFPIHSPIRHPGTRATWYRDKQHKLLPIREFRTL